MNVAAVLPLRPEVYAAHRLHHPECAWVEKNCFVDMWIEMLHALDLQPAAMLGFTLALDFEGEQWPLFKPPMHALSRLYGIEVYELNLWRGDLLSHALHHVGEGKLVISEVDSYWLPDTVGTDYRRQHGKTTIGINALDAERGRLGYFHNAGYHYLQDEDFTQLFRCGAASGALPLYAEFARLDRIEKKSEAELARIAAEMLGMYLSLAPRDNPLRRYAARFPHDVDWLKSEGLPLYHAYAFATLRQLGAAFELAALHLDWLSGHGENGLEPARAAFDEISSGAKALLLKTARVVHTGRSADFAPMLEDMAGAWDRGMGALRARRQ